MSEYSYHSIPPRQYTYEGTTREMSNSDRITFLEKQLALIKKYTEEEQRSTLQSSEYITMEQLQHYLTLHSSIYNKPSLPSNDKQDTESECPTKMKQDNDSFSMFQETKKDLENLRGMITDVRNYVDTVAASVFIGDRDSVNDKLEKKANALQVDIALQRKTDVSLFDTLVLQVEQMHNTISKMDISQKTSLEVLRDQLESTVKVELESQKQKIEAQQHLINTMLKAFGIYPGDDLRQMEDKMISIPHLEEFFKRFAVETAKNTDSINGVKEDVKALQNSLGNGVSDSIMQKEEIMDSKVHSRSDGLEGLAMIPSIETKMDAVDLGTTSKKKTLSSIVVQKEDKRETEIQEKDCSFRFGEGDVLPQLENKPYLEHVSAINKHWEQKLKESTNNYNTKLDSLQNSLSQLISVVNEMNGPLMDELIQARHERKMFIEKYQGVKQ